MARRVLRRIALAQQFGFEAPRQHIEHAFARLGGAIAQIELNYNRASRCEVLVTRKRRPLRIAQGVTVISNYKRLQ